MTDPDRWVTPRDLIELSKATCEGKLADHHMGRVAWTGSRGPEILPVNYTWYAGTVVFRTSAYGSMSTLRDRTAVAFEVDGIDEESAAGWSVVVKGFSQVIYHDQQLARLWSSDAVVPWAGGSRTMYIEITPREITGRSVGLP